ncbi:MAG: hypothetical protein Q4G26_09490 [Paracoccus sp. (in: a-proteobacteria)]|nr:hypothetical protein [Paracoccus sp. (in: a-proteobacteria)]
MDDHNFEDNLRAALSSDCPEMDSARVLRAVRDFAYWRGSVAIVLRPDRDELTAYAMYRTALLGEKQAEADLAWLQIGARSLWGADTAGQIGLCLRERRV